MASRLPDVRGADLPHHPGKIYRTHFDEAHRKAIRQWVTGGGNLWLIGDRGLSVSTRLLGNGRILHVPSLDGLPEEEKS